MARTVTVIGIDPGLTGALALIHDGKLLATADMPVMMKGTGKALVKNEVNPAALAQLLRTWLSPDAMARARFVVETVNSRPVSGPPELCPVCKHDRKALGSSSVFSMGDSIGAIRGTLAALGCRIEWVPAARWKGYFRLPGGHAGKEVARAMAIKLFPAADLARKKDHNRAEALLIAQFAVESANPNKAPF